MFYPVLFYGLDAVYLYMLNSGTQLEKCGIKACILKSCDST